MEWKSKHKYQILWDAAEKELNGNEELSNQWIEYK